MASVQSNCWIESGCLMARWFLLTSDSVVAGVTEELSVSDSDLSSGLWPSSKVSPAADTLQDQQETLSLSHIKMRGYNPFPQSPSKPPKSGGMI